MKRLLRPLALILVVVLFAAGCAVAEQDAAFKPFRRMDRDKPDAWKSELENVRFEKEGLYQFKKVSKKYGIDDLVPNEEGLADLCISASAQFSLP